MEPLNNRTVARLEGFHICSDYRMAKKHKPQKGPNHVWVYPRSIGLLKECGMHTILHYIDVRREKMFQYVVDRPIYDLCRIGWASGGGDWHRDSGGGNIRVPGQQRCRWSWRIEAPRLGRMDGM